MQSPSKGVFILPCELQHTYMCYEKKSFLSRELKRHHYRLERVNETTYKV